MFGIGNKELENAPLLTAGEIIPWKCKHRKHEVKTSIPRDPNPDIFLLYISCGKKTFMVGLNGHDVRRI